MNKIRLLSFFCCAVLLVSCNTRPVKTYADTPQKGTIYISVDESFKPVIEEQIKVYQSTFPDAHIIPSYKPEIDCFKDLQNDSTRLVIVGRGLNDQEIDFYKSTLQYKPQFKRLAYDAVVLIVNQNTTDSVYTITKLRDVLSGKDSTTVIMDGKNATSSVRFLQDSILKGKAFGKNVVAAQNSQAVIEAVTNQTNAIGFVGLNWIGDNYDPKQQEQLKHVKLGLVECVLCPEKGFFAKASPASVSYGEYPLARGIYFILKENATGLGTGFTNFLSLERGQLIFRRSFLVPALINFNKRKVDISSENK